MTRGGVTVVTCPKCGGDLKVVNSRSIGNETARIRKCRKCSKRFGTIEVIDSNRSADVFQRFWREEYAERNMGVNT